MQVPRQHSGSQVNTKTMLSEDRHLVIGNEKQKRVTVSKMRKKNTGKSENQNLKTFTG